eukprot:1044886-Prorocentrum_minimum.AAC.1
MAAPARHGPLARAVRCQLCPPPRGSQASCLRPAALPTPRAPPAGRAATWCGCASHKRHTTGAPVTLMAHHRGA